MGHGRLLLLLSAALVACAVGAPPAATTAAPIATLKASTPATTASARAPGATANGQDSDNDGIADALDACPREPGVGSSTAAESGCPRFVKVEGIEDYILQQVHFTRESSALLAESQPIVDETTELMKRATHVRRVEVAGHTSSDEPSAKALSKARARTVADRMLAGGLDGNALYVCSYGASLPIEDDKTAEGRERNRGRGTAEQAGPRGAPAARTLERGAGREAARSQSRRAVPPHGWPWDRAGGGAGRVRADGLPRGGRPAWSRTNVCEALDGCAQAVLPLLRLSLPVARVDGRSRPRSAGPAGRVLSVR